MPKLPSACPLDCPDTCSLQIDVSEDGRTVLALEGDSRNPLTAGAICGKVRRFADRVHSSERLQHPWRRVRGVKASGSFPRDFEPCSWDEALGFVAGRFAEIRAVHGGEAILPVSYGGSNGVLTEGLLDERLWRRLGALRLHRNICATPSGAAYDGLYGKMPGADLRDHVHADLIVVWGCNPHASGMHHVAIVQEAQKRGAALVVIDPRKTPLARRADVHLAPRPGTDLVVALAVIAELFARGWQDEAFLAKHTTGADVLKARATPWNLARAAEVAGLDAAELGAFVERYHNAQNPVIRLGWGVERSRCGASASAAVLAIPAVAGKFGQRGGGFTASLSRAARLDPSAAVGAAPTNTFEVELSQVGAALCRGTHVAGGLSEVERDALAPELNAALNEAADASATAAGQPHEQPHVHAAFVYNCNPLVTLPDQQAVVQGFARADLFTVVFEQVANDSVDYADVVLPATTFVEHAELKNGYGVGFVYHAGPVIEPVGEARPNAPVFAELLERLGLAEAGDRTGEAELAEHIVATSDFSDAQRDKLRNDGATGSAFEVEHGAAPVPFVDLFPFTPDQRIHLAPASMPGLYTWVELDSPWPLALISPAHVRMTTSTFGESLAGVQSAIMHPADMEARGLAPGDAVRLFNDLGECHVTVATEKDGPRIGTVVLPKGLWRKHTLNGFTSNALVPDHLSDFGRGACYNDARVEVEKL